MNEIQKKYVRVEVIQNPTGIQLTLAREVVFKSDDGQTAMVAWTLDAAETVAHAILRNVEKARQGTN